jgi:hypothetical protein
MLNLTDIFTMPGLKPIYRPSFSDSEIAECERITRQYTAPLHLVQRAKLALLLHEHPDIENPVAARMLDRHENWARYWRKRWVEEGFSLEDKPRSGRKPSFSPRGTSDD